MRPAAVLMASMPEAQLRWTVWAMRSCGTPARRAMTRAMLAQSAGVATLPKTTWSTWSGRSPARRSAIDDGEAAEVLRRHSRQRAERAGERGPHPVKDGDVEHEAPSYVISRTYRTYATYRVNSSPRAACGAALCRGSSSAIPRPPRSAAAACACRGARRRSGSSAATSSRPSRGHHQRPNHLTALRVGHADDRRLGHLGEAGDHLLHLRRQPPGSRTS